ncbi:hypothetical protein J6590_011521 [Homalodisca vitripennis]|nr:hypothetical protein J6590_011521 [Homalodisca vitripennis]
MKSSQGSVKIRENRTSDKAYICTCARRRHLGKIMIASDKLSNIVRSVTGDLSPTADHYYSNRVAALFILPLLPPSGRYTLTIGDCPTPLVSAVGLPGHNTITHKPTSSLSAFDVVVGPARYSPVYVYFDHKFDQCDVQLTGPAVVTDNL